MCAYIWYVWQRFSGSRVAPAQHSQGCLRPDPPQGTAEPCSRDGSTLGKAYLRKGKKCQTGRRGGKQKSEKGQRVPQAQRRRRCSLVEQIYPHSSPGKTPRQSRGVASLCQSRSHPKDCSPQEA